MLKKIITSIGLSSMAILIVACGSAKHGGKSAAAVPGTWQATPIAIDGDSKDWPSPYPNYDSKGMIAYATSNDKEYFYITMETGDELTQMKILKQGMTVSVDTTGKKEAQFNIHYPLPNDNDGMEAAEVLEKQKNQPTHASKKLQMTISKMVDDANQFSLDGFTNSNGGYLAAQKAPCGVKVRMRMDEYKELVWEAAIPLKALYGKEYITAAEAGKPISICYAIKGLKNASAKGEANNTAGTGNMGGGAGGGGMQGGGMPHNASRGGHGGGGRNMGQNPMEHLYESTKTWKQTGLAYSQP